MSNDVNSEALSMSLAKL